MEPIVYVRFQGGNVKESVDTIDQWGGERSLQPSKVAVQSFDFKQPSFPLYSEQSTNKVQGAVLQTEVYEYTGALAFSNAQGGSLFVVLSAAHRACNHYLTKIVRLNHPKAASALPATAWQILA